MTSVYFYYRVKSLFSSASIFAVLLIISCCTSGPVTSPIKSESAVKVPLQPEISTSLDTESQRALEAPEALKSTVPSKSKEAMAEMEMKEESGEAVYSAAADITKKPVREKALKKAQVRYLSADDSNSSASPVIVRKLIRSGKYVQPAIIRTYEFLNYYTFDYPAPVDSEIAIIPEMRPAGEEDEYSLQVAIRSKDRDISEIGRFNITFLVDVSGSMAGDSLDYAKKMITAISKKLRPGDIVSIVSCSRDARIVLDSSKVNSKTVRLLEKEILPSLNANDITNLEKGIVLAYSVANENYSYRYLNRVILLSDGATNAGSLSVDTINRYAKDSDKQGIYLAGIGVGEGFNDLLMDSFTDEGRGAYLFIDSDEEIERIVRSSKFIANFDLAVKDIRLKMVMPPGWEMKEFHGEQVSTEAADITPQYLSPNDQMIYHMTVKGDASRDAEFEFEAEYTALGKSPSKIKIKALVSDMLSEARNILKGDAVVEYAEMLKKIVYPLDANQESNLAEYSKAKEKVAMANDVLNDPELTDILKLMDKYRKIITYGEDFKGVRDRDEITIDACLGISPNSVKKVEISGANMNIAAKALSRLLYSTCLVPQEGYRFFALSSGPVGNPNPAGSGQISSKRYKDPLPEYMGNKKVRSGRRSVYDLNQITLTLKAPHNAKSFSFDFNFFSAEYPEYVNQDFNDSFYAILRAKSTNRGKSTNISFDSNNNAIEVDNNYFQNPFHPIPNTGTGFDYHGSTGWLRTSWPIKGGEVFSLTFSIHDEGDAIYDSLVILDNFRFHDYEAVGTTDPLN